MRCLFVIANNLKRYKRLLILIFVALLLLPYLKVGVFYYNKPDQNEEFGALEYFDNSYADKNFLSPVISAAQYDNMSMMVFAATKKTMPLCPDYPPNLAGNVSKSTNFMQELQWPEIRAANRQLSKSGFHSPKDCRARHKVAIIIPLRGREAQLRILLNHMHPIWQRQQLDYQVYTVTQTGDHLFNRAKLINAGVAEASKDRKYDCYVFHDVDLLLEDDRCLYWCHEENPRHVAMYMDKFSYKPLTYEVPCSPSTHFIPWFFRVIFPVVSKVPYFGGVSMLTHKQFMDVNGFSNIYWGWGGEDDDIYLRLWQKGYSMANPYENKCSFHMIPHDHESSNAENHGRYSLLYYSVSRMERDGFNTLKYKVISKEQESVYTNITVDIGRPTEKMADFMSNKLPWGLKCFEKMPWH